MVGRLLVGSTNSYQEEERMRNHTHHSHNPVPRSFRITAHARKACISSRDSTENCIHSIHIVPIGQCYYTPIIPYTPRAPRPFIRTELEYLSFQPHTVHKLRQSHAYPSSNRVTCPSCRAPNSLLSSEVGERSLSILPWLVLLRQPLYMYTTHFSPPN